MQYTFNRSYLFRYFTAWTTVFDDDGKQFYQIQYNIIVNMNLATSANENPGCKLENI